MLISAHGLTYTSFEHNVYPWFSVAGHETSDNWLAWVRGAVVSKKHPFIHSFNIYTYIHQFT